MLGTIQDTSYNGHALIDFINQLADVSTFDFKNNRLSRNLFVVVMTMHFVSIVTLHDLVIRKHDLMNDQILSFCYTLACCVGLVYAKNHQYMIFTSADGRAKDERCVQYLFKYSITVALYCPLSAFVSRSMTHCIIPSPWLCNVLTDAQHGSLLGGSLRVFDAMM